ncbi:hypothetical protein GIB67_035451 [Kingdonia uniflora]|uniref:Uncharacterized protein n=1 Tax=Kingdonia uniflora TaxID=39325 RepID=A0A7J7P0C2_9MAGN|nr:hypothetical protein GIB67_035451 [Kingdonia uniflora]
MRNNTLLFDIFEMAGIVVVFDFDKTIIDCDSDNWVVDELGATGLFEQLLPTMPWNTLMDRMMEELHLQGRTIEEIAECLKQAPLDPRIIDAIKSAYALGCDLKIVSDANMFFIETILKHHGLTDYFSEINTNPSYIVEENKLRIFPHHDFTSSPHGCVLCPPNMCKGIVMERIKASAFKEGKKQFIYLGDGKGDFCPSLRLREGDRLMPRKNYPLWELICSNPLSIKAEIHEWSDGEELKRILLYQIDSIVYGDQIGDSIIYGDKNTSDMLVSSDSKFQSSLLSAHNSVPQVLRVVN